MDVRFEGSVVLVTGASTGIGAAIASAFGSSGAKVVVHYHSSERQAREVASAIERAGGEAFLARADVCDPVAVSALVKAVVDHFGTIDILVNNAGGLLERHPIEEMPDEMYAKVMDLNIGSAFRVSKQVIPIMKRAGGGSIINLTSVAARNGGGGGAVLYAASKGAVSTFTRGLAKELAPFKIRVNAIAPGAVLTPFHDKYTKPEMLAEQSRAAPLGRAAQAEEIVGAALFLASERMSSFITGEIVEVNGGVLMS
jgi:3-oxoacyl-[acyl-carrier protein] reductase